MQADNLPGLSRRNPNGFETLSPDTSMIPASDPQQYYVIPLSIQQEGDLCVVGSTDLGDFYQFPNLGVEILQMLEAGNSPAAIKSRLAQLREATVDVDDFLRQLTEIGFIYPESRRQIAQDRLQILGLDTRRTFSVDRRIARAVFSSPVLAFYLAVVLFAVVDAIANPALRLNLNAFYIETNRTPLLAAVVVLSLLETAMHEVGHMLAAARYGVKSKYGIGNRLWNIVAESDITGILTLPKQQRYLPMFAGLLVDSFVASLLTILLGTMVWHDVSPFAIQVVQVLVLEIVIGMAWQFNVFIKTDIYFVLCNYFSYPDLDRDARLYLRDLLCRITLGRFGQEAPPGIFSKLIVLQLFSLVWVVGRIFSLAILVGVFLPTIWQYIRSSIELMTAPSAQVWIIADTVAYVAFSLTMLGTGMYMWLKNR